MKTSLRELSALLVRSVKMLERGKRACERQGWEKGETAQEWTKATTLLICEIEEAIRPTRIPSKRAKPRRGPMRDPEYRMWLRMQVCVAPENPEYPQLYSAKHLLAVLDPAHTQNNGIRSKGPDSSCVPLCRNHHEEYDKNRKAFEKKYGVSMAELAREHYARFLKEKEQHGADKNVR
jgi:hypothetical protein